MFERLAVFADADVRAIEAVAAAAGATGAAGDASTGDGAIDVIESLASLIEKSLVRQVDAAGGEPRVRDARDDPRVRDRAARPKRPEAAAVRRAHATYYADLAASLNGDLSGGDRDRAMAAMTTEVGNLRIACATGSSRPTSAS